MVHHNWHYFDGPHAIWEHGCINFDLKNGKLLSIKDMFKNWKRTEQRLSALIRKSIAEEDECDLADLSKELDFSKIDQNTNNFYLTPNGMGFTFSFFDPSRWNCDVAFIEKEELFKIGADPKFWQP